MLPAKLPKQPKRASRWRSLDTHALRGLLHYDDGKLYWLPRPQAMFVDTRSFKTWNTRFAHREAFTASHSEGYLVGRIFGQIEFAHRVIWVLHYGDLGDLEIDHKNGLRSDNHLENLRAVSREENRQNLKRPITNKTGAVGVRSEGRRWRATIQLDGMVHNLGLFDTFDQAVAARKLGEVRLKFHPNHGRD